MKKIIAICLTLSLVAIFISGCEQKDKTTSSAITIGESDITTSQTETSSRKSSKPIIDRTSSVQTSSSEENSSVVSSQEHLNGLIEYVSMGFVEPEEGETIMGVKLTSNDTKYTDVVSKIYSDQEIEDIIEMLTGKRSLYPSYRTVKKSIEELNVQYPIEYIKKGENGKYTVSYFSNKKILRIHFYEDGKEIDYMSESTISGTKADFENLSKDNTQEDVMEIDPDYDHYSSYVGSGDPAGGIKSVHFTKDGFRIAIEYEKRQEYLNDHEKGNYIKKIEIGIF